MGNNIGYLTSDNSKEGSEKYTPYYAVDPILKYLQKDKTIWCPFDEEWSAFYQTLNQNGYNVTRSSLNDGKDFFTYEPNKWDIIVSNPPFYVKDKILKRLYQLGKPFAILLPTNSLQGKTRTIMFKKNGLQLLTFDKRIKYHNLESMSTYEKQPPFASSYFCWNLLPKDLIFKELNEYEKPLI